MEDYEHVEIEIPYNTDISIAEDEFIQFLRKATNLDGLILLNFDSLCSAYSYFNNVRLESVESMVRSLKRKEIIIDNNLILLGFVSGNVSKSELWDSIFNNILSVKENSFEVYTVHDNDICLYVGEGKKNRHLHALSGKSHVYELNRLHFSGSNLSVKVVRLCASKEEATKVESELIRELKPLFNKRLPA